MPEPLAVAFVEVRPELDDFRSNAEEELRASLGEDLDVVGKVTLDTDQARREVSELQRSLEGIQGVGTQQLQFEGLGQAEQQLEGLTDQASTFGDTIGTSATAVSALIARQEQLAGSSGAVRSALRQEQRELARTTEEEQRLVRIRSGRAAGVAGLRFAGVGLGAGVALFAATRALRDLGDALEVTGDEASTFEGKTRNAFSNLLRGDLVGAFQALTDNTRTYSAEQLRLINQTPQLTDALNELGQAANIARSTSEVLAGLAQPPQFLQTALAREEAQGDVSGQVRVLEEQLAFFKQAEDTARQIARSVEERNAILEPIFAGEARVRDELRKLLEQGAGGGAASTTARATAGLGIIGSLKAELTNLERERNELRAELPRGGEAGEDLGRLREQLAGVNRKIEEETGRIRGEQDRHVAEVNEGQRGDRAEHFAALAIAAVDTAELAQLQRERAALVAAIAKKEVEAEELKRNKGRLGDVNAEIEAVIADIRAEQERHTRALIEGGLIGSLGTTALENEARGDTAGQIRSLQAEALLIQALLPALKASDTTTSNLYEEYLQRLISLNSRIEQLQDGITAESERHSRTSQEKRDEADQAFLRSFESRTHRANLRKTIAAATAGLGDDIAASEALQRIYREEIALARKRIRDKELRDATIASLTAQLVTEEQSERELRQENRRERIARQEERLDLNIQLAQANENARAEIRAHEAKIKFLQERIRHTREGTNQRRRLRVEIAQERAEIRRLNEELGDASDDAASFGAMATAFLQQLRGFSSNLATNTFPRGSQLTQVPSGTFTTGFSQPREPEAFVEPAQRPPLTTREERGVRSPFEHGRGQGTATTQAAADLRDSRGAPINQSQGDELIHLGRQTVTLLRDIKAGQGHNEAAKARKLGRNAQTPGVD